MFQKIILSLELQTIRIYLLSTMLDATEIKDSEEN